MTTPSLSLLRHDASSALGIRNEIEDVYATSHADIIAVDPFFHPDRFWERLVDIYSQALGFEMVGGYVHDRLVGYGFGCTRTAERAANTWEQIRQSLPDISVPTEPESIFIFNEFAVHPDYQQQGNGRAIHDFLLLGRSEPVAHLLVRPENPARAHYLAWGWRKYAERKPFDDAPTFDALIKDLREASQ